MGIVFVTFSNLDFEISMPATGGIYRLYRTLSVPLTAGTEGTHTFPSS